VEGGCTFECSGRLVASCGKFDLLQPLTKVGGLELERRSVNMMPELELEKAHGIRNHIKNARCIMCLA
jgi:hypothetical protein